MHNSAQTEPLTIAGITTGSIGLAAGTLGDWFVHGGWLQLLSGAAIVATIVFQVRQDRRQERLSRSDSKSEKKNDDSCDR